MHPELAAVDGAQRARCLLYPEAFPEGVRPIQPAEAVRDEVRFLDMAGQHGTHPAGHVFDQGRIRDYEALAGALVARALVPPPEVLELDRFDVGLQGSPPTR